MRSLFSKLGRLRATSFSIQPVLLASLAVCTLVIGVRQMGVLQELELSYFDKAFRLRPDEGSDPRLLVVAVTEEDIQGLGGWPTSDRTLERLLKKLKQYQPRAIGLDIYRDLAVRPGSTELTTHLQVNDNIVAVCKVSDANGLGVAPPAAVPKSRLGFSDLVLDRGGVVRRSLMFLTPEKTSRCPATNSFSLQLALQYLKKEGIQPKLTAQQELQLGSTIFKPIEKNTGGYQNIDARGYQVLLNYRSASAVARQVSLTDVLSDPINPNWIKDRIVLIGVTATKIKDYFNTPYNLTQESEPEGKMAGVLVHAQIVSQILSAVLDGRSLFWYWSEWQEVLWIWVWSFVGGSLAWFIRHPLPLGLGGVAALVGLGGICYAILTQGGWIPLVPPALALIATSASLICYRIYLTSHQPQTSGAIGSGGINPTRNAAATTIANRANTTEEKTNPLLGGRYNIIDRIGAGGFGQTFLAEDTQRPGNPFCVVKQLMPSMNEQFMQLARRLFNAEAEALEKLGRYDQIPHLLAYFEQDRQFYLVEEFIRGHPLSKELISGKQLPESQVVTLLRDLLAILKFIHSQNLIHRDIKPSNIIRRESDQKLVLVDFGSVKQLQTQITMAQESYTVAIGTVGYTAPEQFLGKPVFTSDIYALGIIGIQAVTGLIPTVELEEDTITHEVIWRHHVQVSDRLAAILDKMVRYYPRERYQSAAQVLQALENFY